MVPCFFLKPNWCERISLLFSMMGGSRCSSIFSRILDRTGRRLIGRYDVMSFGFLPGFVIIMICPTFHWQGNYSILSMALYIYVIALRLLRDSSCRIFPMIRS